MKRVFTGVALALSIILAIVLWLIMDGIQIQDEVEEAQITVAPRPTRR